MVTVAEELATAVKDALPRLLAIGEAESSAPRAPGKWSRKQVLGHLIDSALNNHQRFVRAQIQDAVVLPGYEQEAWVEVQAYADRPWEALVQLWADVNEHLAHVVARVAPERLATPCTIGGGEPVTLEFVVTDYVRHLRHHLEQILDSSAAEGKQHPPYSR